MTRAFFSRFSFSIKRVLTDNGSCYRDHRFTRTLLQQHIKHCFTRRVGEGRPSPELTIKGRSEPASEVPRAAIARFSSSELFFQFAESWLKAQCITTSEWTAPLRRLSMFWRSAHRKAEAQ